MVSIPTGPPLKRWIMVLSISLSRLSRPMGSTPSASSAFLVMSISILPSPFTWEKSLTRFSILLATLGVPLERFAISSMDCSSAVTSSIPADRPMIFISSSVVYSSNLQLTPNRSLKGAERLPALVVAPIRVNFAISRRMDLADGPLPMIMSSAKSSIAEYSTSSTVRLSLCISSMNSTSFSLRFVSIAARSPARSMAGPDVILISTPISLAIIPASVVLPSPGGP